MKQCNVPLEIKLLDLKKAHEMARHHNLHRFERSLFFQCGVKKMEIDIPKVRPELPQLDVTFIPLLITMVSLSKFSFNNIHYLVNIINTFRLLILDVSGRSLMTMPLLKNYSLLKKNSTSIL